MFWQRAFEGSLPASPWRELAQLQREMNRLFEDVGDPAAFEAPAVNVWSAPDHAVVTAELPGVQAADLEVSVTGETVTLRGSRKADPAPDGKKVLRRERRPYEFSRSLRLPFAIDAEKVEARLDPTRVLAGCSPASSRPTCRASSRMKRWARC